MQNEKRSRAEVARRSEVRREQVLKQRANEARSAWEEHQKAVKAEAAKTAHLRTLRLAKEAEARAAEKPKKRAAR